MACAFWYKLQGNFKTSSPNSTQASYDYDFTGVTQSPEASFNDPRCDGEMVCPNTPLLFTCNVTGSTSDVATVRLPSGQAVGITIMDMINVINGPLPDGVNTSSYNVEGSGPVNYSLTLSIERADILDGMDVICDARTLPPTTDEATCPVATGTM